MRIPQRGKLRHNSSNSTNQSPSPFSLPPYPLSPTPFDACYAGYTNTVTGNKCNETHDTRHYTNKACALLARYKNTKVVSAFKDWSIHDVGAMTAFISGLTFCWLQCAMSYKLKDHGVINSSAVCHSRAMLSLMITLCVAIFAAFQTKANLEWALARPRYHFLAKLKWGPQDPGYLFHVISSLAEWSMCGGMLLFMLTFTYEFQQIVITSDISSTEYW